MREKFVKKTSMLLLLTLSFSIVFLAFSVQPVSSFSTIIVPDNYPTIQAAINAANVGDTIIVRDGIYTENIFVNKTLTITSEHGPSNCIVHPAQDGSIFQLAAHDINLNGFTISGITTNYGIVLLAEVVHDKVFRYDGCQITNNIICNNDRGVSLEGIGWYYHISNSLNTFSNNIVTNNKIGFYFWYSVQNTIVGNTISQNSEYGIYLSGDQARGIWYNSKSNIIENNAIQQNLCGIYLRATEDDSIIGNNIIANNNGIILGVAIQHGSIPSNDVVYHNNFINNIQQVSIDNSYSKGTNIWDNDYPSGGNYWSNYNGVDNNYDNIGDTPYIIDANNVDRYPLMTAWTGSSVTPSPSPTATPTSTPEPTPTATPTPSPMPVSTSISDLQARVIEAQANQAIFVYADPYRMTRAVSTYDVASGSMVNGMCHNLQTQSFDNNPLVVSQDIADIGRLVITEHTALMFGGPAVNLCVNYLENNRFTPVFFQAETELDGTHLKFVETATGTTKVDRLASSMDFVHEDYFVIMTLLDESGNQVFISYGFDWKGTWSTGFLTQAIYPDIQSYTNAYYIFYWQDTNGDGIPQPNEMTQVIT